jgi:hypothetical protein
MARVTEVAHEKMFLARGILCCPMFSRPSLLCYEYYVKAQILYMIIVTTMLRLNIFFYKNQKR